MGIFDKMVSAADKAGELSGMSEKAIAKKDAKAALREKRKDEVAIVQTLAAPSSIVKGMFGAVTLWQQRDGLVYLKNDADTLYEIVGFSWDGPQYDQLTTSELVGKEDGEQKRKGRVIGAAVGTLVAPGIGTAIGAAYGSGNKKNTKDIEQSTTTRTSNVEIETLAVLKLRNVATNQMVSLQFKGKKNDMIALQTFAESAIEKRAGFQEAAVPTSQEHVQSDPYEELKKLKELLDMGIVTQEEFDAKKAILLGF